MSRLLAFVGDCRASAAAEMALVAPMLCVLMLGSAEMGRYFYSQHVMVKAVRDGAVFAARQPIDKFHCDTGAIDAPVPANTQALVQTGVLANGSNLLPQWAASSGVTFAMSLSCVTTAGTTTIGGIYTANAGKAPVLTVSAAIPYNPILGGFGFAANLTLHATEQTAVTGI